MSLTVEGVWKSFAHRGRTQHVLRDVDLAFEPGTFTSLTGHSGCGKSTLINLLGGLSRPDAGTIALDGSAVTAPGPDRAMVFQNYSLLPRLSLVDNVRVAVRSSRPELGRDHADVAAERYLRAVGLWEARDKRPWQVSGGMQQRAAVARGFAVEPRVLLLDEPFGALDALTRARLQGQLVELWRSESDTEYVVMVTHGVDEAALLSDRIVVMGAPPRPSILDIIPVDIARPRDRIRDAAALESVQARLHGLMQAIDEQDEAELVAS
jgi:ABC-type nitrate/sulfonate/bicarbonate transport system ATPase subunit